MCAAHVEHLPWWPTGTCLKGFRKQKDSIKWPSPLDSPTHGKNTWISPELQGSPFQDLTNPTQFSRRQCPLPVLPHQCPVFGVPAALSMACACKTPFFLPGTSSRPWEMLPSPACGQQQRETEDISPTAQSCPVPWCGHFHLLCAFRGGFLKGHRNRHCFWEFHLPWVSSEKDRKGKNHGCGKRRREMKILMGSLSPTGWKGHPGLAEAKLLHAMSS